MNEGRIRLDVKDFFYKCKTTNLTRYFLFLHSYEFIAALFIATYFSSSNILIGLSLGFGSHLLLDVFNWPEGSICYSLVYRMSVKFHGPSIFPKR